MFISACSKELPAGVAVCLMNRSMSVWYLYFIFHLVGLKWLPAAVFVIAVKLFWVFWCLRIDRETYFNENVSYDVGTLAIQQAPLYQALSPVFLLDSYPNWPSFWAIQKHLCGRNCIQPSFWLVAGVVLCPPVMEFYQTCLHHFSLNWLILWPLTAVWVNLCTLTF